MDSKDRERFQTEKSLCKKYQSCDDYVNQFCKTLSKQEAKEMRDFVEYVKRNNIFPELREADAKVLCNEFTYRRLQQQMKKLSPVFGGAKGPGKTMKKGAEVRCVDPSE